MTTNEAPLHPTDNVAGATLAAPGYESLARILSQAFSQSAHGKGKERHANGKPFDEQPILKLAEMTGPGGTAFQAMKKTQEALGMFSREDHRAAIHELLGAIVYTAATIRAIELDAQR